MGKARVNVRRSNALSEKCVLEIVANDGTLHKATLKKEAALRVAGEIIDVFIGGDGEE